MEERGSHFCAEACVRRGEMKAEEKRRERRGRMGVLWSGGVRTITQARHVDDGSQRGYCVL